MTQSKLYSLKFCLLPKKPIRKLAQKTNIMVEREKKKLLKIRIHQLYPSRHYALFPFIIPPTCISQTPPQKIKICTLLHSEFTYQRNKSRALNINANKYSNIPFLDIFPRLEKFHQEATNHISTHITLSPRHIALKFSHKSEETLTNLLCFRRDEKINHIGRKQRISLPLCVITDKINKRSNMASGFPVSECIDVIQFLVILFYILFFTRRGNYNYNAYKYTKDPLQ